MPRNPSSLAIVNARVWTGDSRRPWADAVLVHDGTIEAVGSSAEVKKRCREDTVVVDARKMIVAASPAAWSESGLVGRGAPADLVVIDVDAARVTADLVRTAPLALEVAGGVVVMDRDGLVRREAAPDARPLEPGQ